MTTNAAMTRADRSLPAVRTARIPAPGVWRARSWCELVYLLIDFPLGVATAVTVIALLACGAALSVVYVGVPLFLGALLLARAAGALRRAMARPLLGIDVPAPGRAPRRRRGFGGAILDAATDRASWRAFAYHLVHLATAPLTLAAAIGWLAGLSAVTHPLWRRYLPAELGSDGAWHRGMSFGSGYFVDTPARLAALALAGAAALLLAPVVVRGLASMERRLIVRLLGPAARP